VASAVSEPPDAARVIAQVSATALSLNRLDKAGVQAGAGLKRAGDTMTRIGGTMTRNLTVPIACGWRRGEDGDRL
jgi:hypothetical protein